MATVEPWQIKLQQYSNDPNAARAELERAQQVYAQEAAQGGGTLAFQNTPRAQQITRWATQVADAAGLKGDAYDWARNTATTATGTPASVLSTLTNKLGGGMTWQQLTNALQGMLQPVNLRPTLGYEQASAQARDQLRPAYQQQSQQVLRNLTDQLVRTGFFGQAPGAADVILPAQAQLEGAYNSEIARLAQSLMQGDRQFALEEANLAMQNRGQMLQAALGALSESGAMERAQMSGLQGLLNYQETQRANQFTKALSSAQFAGQITTPEQAALLGFPVGTTSAELRMHEADLQQRYAAIAAEDRRAAASRAQQNQLTSLNLLFDTLRGGTAPQDITLPNGMVIKQGTQLGQPDFSNMLYGLQYQAELKLQQIENQAEAAQQQYGVNKDTARVLVSILDNPSKAAAMSDFNILSNAIRGNNKELLGSMGITIPQTIKENLSVIKAIIDQKQDWSVTEPIPGMATGVGSIQYNPMRPPSMGGAFAPAGSAGYWSPDRWASEITGASSSTAALMTLLLMLGLNRRRR